MPWVERLAYAAEWRGAAGDAPPGSPLRPWLGDLSATRDAALFTIRDRQFRGLDLAPPAPIDMSHPNGSWIHLAA